jgi:hypothetical protein
LPTGYPGTSTIDEPEPGDEIVGAWAYADVVEQDRQFRRRVVEAWAAEAQRAVLIIDAPFPWVRKPTRKPRRKAA